MLEGFILGTITGICIGYLVIKTKIVYDKENHCLILPENLDEESVNSLKEFIEECIQRVKLENLREKKK